MAVSAHFLESLRETLEFVPELRVKRMFGGAGVYSAELMFAIADDDVLYLKADAETAPEFAARELAAFLYRDRNGRQVQMSYHLAPEELWEDQDAARLWVERAIGAALRGRKA